MENLIYKSRMNIQKLFKFEKILRRTLEKLTFFLKKVIWFIPVFTPVQAVLYQDKFSVKTVKKILKRYAALWVLLIHDYDPLRIGDISN